MVQVAGVVDADTHIDETDATWEYMTGADLPYKPISVDPGRPLIKGDIRPHRFWLVDGKAGLRRWRGDDRTGTTEATRQLLDVPARVKHMDEMGVEVQVIYPTYLLASPTNRAEVELAMYRSYNRWLAERTAESNGRLRWVVMPPFLSMDKAIEELRFGKEHGAVGVFKRAMDVGKVVSDPYFFPLYEEAQRLDLPICVHTGGDSGGLGQYVRPQIGCFPALAMNNVPERFPTLRFGVIEAMASWVPYVVADLRAKNIYGGSKKLYAENPMAAPEDDFLRANRFYVTCQTSDDIAYLLKFGAGDSLMIGTDYTHADQSGVIEALNYVEGLGEAGEIPMESARKILVDNPRAFYGL